MGFATSRRITRLTKLKTVQKSKRKANITSPCRGATSLSFRKERDVLAKPKQGEVKGYGFAVKVALIKRSCDVVSLLENWKRAQSGEPIAKISPLQ